MSPIYEDDASRFWAGEREYVDGPDGVDEYAMWLLVDSRVAWYLGDKERWQRSHWVAFGQLVEQGHTEESAAVAIGRVADSVTERANALVIGLQQAAEDFAAAWEHIGNVDDFLDQIRRDGAR